VGVVESGSEDFSPDRVTNLFRAGSGAVGRICEAVERGCDMNHTRSFFQRPGTKFWHFIGSVFKPAKWKKRWAEIWSRRLSSAGHSRRPDRRTVFERDHFRDPSGELGVTGIFASEYLE
jgi:hypothetical protein